MSQIYQAKIKCKEKGSYFYKNKKYRLLEIEKKTFQLFHFRCVFSENIQSFVGKNEKTLTKENLEKTNEENLNDYNLNWGSAQEMAKNGKN